MPFALRLRLDQRDNLEFLRDCIDGAPPINGLIQVAVDRYFTYQLEEPAVRAAYERRASPRLQVVSDAPRRNQ